MSVRRVLRGGSYDLGTWSLRASDRYGVEPEYRRRDFGFRVVIVKRRKP